MKQTLKQIKISDIPEALQRLGINLDTTINLTIETVEEEQEDILTLFQQIGQEAPIQKFPFISQAIQTLEKKGTTVTITTKDKRFALKG
jgi:uncharacterized protein YqgV (UPF0045/DUF77 family)